MTDRLHALAFNELSRALGDVDRFVALSERDEITCRLVTLIRSNAYREMAERVLLVSEVTRGLRCPFCHGNPAVKPHFLDKDPRYRCGAGHEWIRPAVVEDLSAHPDVLLRRIAESGELPPIPARLEQEG